MPTVPLKVDSMFSTYSDILTCRAVHPVLAEEWSRHRASCSRALETAAQAVLHAVAETTRESGTAAEVLASELQVKILNISIHSFINVHIYIYI